MRIFIDEQPNSLVHRLDPRVRLVMAVAFALVTVQLQDWTALTVAVVLGGYLLALARMVTARMLRRLTEINLFFLFLLVFMPLSTPGEVLVRVGSLSWTREGLLLAMKIGLKANAVMITCGALLVTMEPAHLGFAMTRLGVPEKLAHVFLFMVRYIAVIHEEYHRLRHAMKLRGFAARCNSHSLRSLGYLLGMLFVRSIDQADRVVAAMKCRGFRGKYYVLEHFRVTARDLCFSGAFACALVLVGVLEWS